MTEENPGIDRSRRRLLHALSCAPLMTALPGGLTLGASAGNGRRLVLVIARGALDGLAAVAPYGDPALRLLRDSLLVPEAQLLKLDSFFGLHPALGGFNTLYEAGELAICHAVASPYRERSHFDGQNVLEIGRTAPDLSASGWLNRCVPLLAGSHPDGTASPALAVGQAIPAVLQGAADVASWAPAILPEPSESTMARLQALYAEDEFLGVRLQQALMANEMAGESGAAMASRPARNFPVLVDAAARFLAVEDGPAVAVLDSNGWDTHANQGGAQGQLALRLAELDRGIADLKTKLGAAWHNTVVMVVTEFGRTAAQNGTNGTDHGTAGVAFLAGGAVRGGQIVGDWPGLASGNLYQGRDLAPTTDLRSLFKTVLRDHLGLAGSAIDSAVFPSSGEAGYLRGLVS